MRVMGSELVQMQAMQVEAGGQVSGLAGIETKAVENTSGVDFGQLLKQAIDNVNELQGDAKTKATAFEMGDRSISLGDVMIASQKSSVAFEATVQVRNKLLDAYKDIMSMPV